jgi:hypothetical protein
MRKSAKSAKSVKRKGGKSMRKTHRRGKMIKGGIGVLSIISLALSDYLINYLHNTPQLRDGPEFPLRAPQHNRRLADAIRKTFYNGKANLVSQQTELVNSKQDAINAAQNESSKVPVYIDNDQIKIVVPTEMMSSTADIPISETENIGNSTIITLGKKEE